MPLHESDIIAIKPYRFYDLDEARIALYYLVRQLGIFSITVEPYKYRQNGDIPITLNLSRKGSIAPKAARLVIFV